MSFISPPFVAPSSVVKTHSDQIICSSSLISNLCVCGRHCLPLLGAHLCLPLHFQVFLVGSDLTCPHEAFPYAPIKPSLISPFFRPSQTLRGHAACFSLCVLFADCFLRVTTKLYLLQGEAFYSLLWTLQCPALSLEPSRHGSCLFWARKSLQDCLMICQHKPVMLKFNNQYQLL